MGSIKTRESREIEKRLLKLLMIEDDAADFELFHEVLDGALNLSFDLRHASTLAEGLQNLDSRRFDLIIVDLNLPDNRGLDTLSTVQQHTPDVPVIVLTGLDDEEVGLDAVHLGAQDYLVKNTLESKSLARSIQYAVERFSLRRQLQVTADELARSEKKYLAMIKENSDALLIIDRDGFVRFMNPAAEQLLQVSAESYIGEMFSYPVGEGRMMELELIKSNTIVDMRWVRTEWEGQPAFLVSMRDITHMKEAEREVVRHSRLLNAINSVFRETMGCLNEDEVANTCLDVAEALTDSRFGFIGEMNAEGRLNILAVSRSFWEEAKKCGFKREPTQIEWSLNSLWKKVVSDGKSRIINQRINASKIRIPEGHPPVYSFMAVPIFRGGDVSGLIALANKRPGYTTHDREDVEQLSLAYMEAYQRKRVERVLEEEHSQLMSIFDGIDQPVFAIDPESHGFLYVNDAFKKNWGNTDDQKCHEVFHGSERPCKNCTGTNLTQREALPPFVFDIECRGNGRMFHAYDKPIRWTDNRLILMGIAMDFTEQRSAEKALETKVEELNQSRGELEQFAYITSHDLKAPLRAIQNLTSWIREDIEDMVQDDTKRNLDLLQSRVRRMHRMIDDILEYSRIGKREVEIESVDVAALLDEILDLLQPPDDFSIVIQEGMPTLETAATPLRQVFFNLIGNALKHHPETRGRIDVRVEDEGDRYAFSVEDDGAGIPEEYQEKIFSMFQTLQSRDKVEGSGIGLAMVKKILESCGGGIQVISRNGEGSRFRFTWPKSWIREA